MQHYEFANIAFINDERTGNQPHSTTQVLVEAAFISL